MSGWGDSFTREGGGGGGGGHYMLGYIVRGGQYSLDYIVRGDSIYYDTGSMKCCNCK